MAMMFRGFGNPRLRGFPQDDQKPDLFGFNQQPVTTPPFSPGMPADDVMAPTAPANPQTGFFQKNGMGLNILGSVADAVSTAYGGAPVFGIARQQDMARRREQQQFEQAQILRQQERAADNQTWLDRQIWERDHPAPRAPHYWETNNGSLATIDPATGQPKVLYEDPTPKVTWTQVDLPDGRKQLIPSINGVMAGGGGTGGTPVAAPPAKPVGKLTPIQGGATPGGSRPF